MQTRDEFKLVPLNQGQNVIHPSICHNGTEQESDDDIECVVDNECTPFDFRPASHANRFDAVVEEPSNTHEVVDVELVRTMVRHLRNVPHWGRHQWMG